MLCPKLLILLSVLVMTTAWDVRERGLRSPPRRRQRAAQQLKLVKIALIHRHGNRSPASSFPTNPYPPDDSSVWPDGPGQLTIEGKKRMLHLGRFLRQRYSSFLSDAPIDVYVRSSAIERCLSSAQLVLTGTYPPTPGLVIEEGLNWQPVPIHTRDKPMDRMLVGPNEVHCPSADAVMARNLASVTQTYMKRHATHIPLMEQGSGLNITTPCDVMALWDTLNSIKYSGKRLPDWANPSLMARMERISEVCWCVMGSGRTIPRLNAGVFLHDLQTFFSSAAPNLVNGLARKAYFYSSHDARVVPVLYALDIFDGKIVEYGVAVLFELLESPEKELFVRTFFVPDVLEAGKEELRPAHTRGCPSTPGIECTTEQFFAGVQDYMMDSETHEKECAETPRDAENLLCPM